jgi:tRNA threonylcarbamoyladenosine biosynthesis protein TsaB
LASKRWRSDRPLILAFDTSAAHCAAALLSGGRVRARREEAMAKGQAERLMPMLEEVLDEAGVAWAGLDAVAVCVGPGNFTGLRLSVAAARGLALSLGKPAVGVTRFEALAEGYEELALVLVEAPRDRVHAQVLRNGVPEGEPILADPGALTAPAGAVCVGFGAAAVAERLGLPMGQEGSMADPASVAKVAAVRLAGGAAIPRPAPLYLRPAAAAPASEPPPVMLD